jgi:hypothetical protein
VLWRLQPEGNDSCELCLLIIPWSKGWISAVVFFGKIITTIIPSFDFRDSEEGCAGQHPAEIELFHPVFVIIGNSLLLAQYV